MHLDGEPDYALLVSGVVLRSIHCIALIDPGKVKRTAPALQYHGAPWQDPKSW